MTGVAYNRTQWRSVLDIRANYVWREREREIGREREKKREPEECHLFVQVSTLSHYDAIKSSLKAKQDIT